METRQPMIPGGSTEWLEIDQAVRDFEYTMISRHMHETYELYYLLEGERYYFIDRQTYLIQAGDIVLIPPYQIHKTTPAGESYHNRILMQISGRMLDPILAACGLPSLETFCPNEALILKIPEEHQVQLTALLGEIGEALHDHPRYYQTAVRLKLGEIFLLLTRNRKNGSSLEDRQDITSWKHQKVQEVADYLLLHPEKQESLEELAEHFFISKSYLSRIFREITSFTVSEYRTSSRIRRARTLLETSDYTITEIAEKAGFENVTYFDRVFKRYVGQSPLRYQKNLHT